MIVVSCRRRLGLGGTIIFDDELHWDHSTFHGGTFNFSKKRVLVIVHGTANTMAQLRVLASEIENRNPNTFDVFVMFAWPGGATGAAYLMTRFTAVKRAAKFLAQAIDEIYEAGALTVDIDAHSLGVPIALEAAIQTEYAVAGLWLKAGACGRDLSKYRDELVEYGTMVAIFHSPKDWIVTGLYRIWFGFTGALGAYGEKTKGGNIGVSYDVSKEIGGSHVDYRRCSMVIQAMRNEMIDRRMGVT